MAKQRSNNKALEPTRVAKHRKRSPGNALNGAAAVPGSNIVVQERGPRTARAVGHHELPTWLNKRAMQKTRP